MTETQNLQKIIKSGGSFHEFKKTSDVEHFPQAFTNYVKNFGEIYFWEKGNFHVITRADHAKEILTSSDYTADRGSFFISRMQKMDLGLIKDFFEVVKKMMVMSDDSDHTKKRRVAAVGFEDHILEAFQKTMKSTVKQLVQDMRGQKEIEFVESVSKRLPSIVLADLFSIPMEDRENFQRWSNIMTGFFGGASEYRNEDGIEVNESAIALREYFKNLVILRRKNPGNDYVSVVLKAQEKMGLGDDDLISQLIMMLVAGMATTTDQINNCIFLLALNPDIQKEIRDNLNLVSPMIEEFKRLDPAVTFIFRVAKNFTRVGNQPIAPGDVMFISTHAINRDLPNLERPDDINIHRKQAHFAYGYGAHYCIGAKLAKMEMQSLFTEILTELPAFTIDADKKSERDHYSLSFSGFKKLHLRFQ